jgi:hypothetical protein
MVQSTISCIFLCAVCRICLRVSSEVLKTLYFYNTVMILELLFIIAISMLSGVINTYYYLMIQYVSLFQTNNTLRRNFVGFSFLSRTFSCMLLQPTYKLLLFILQQRDNYCGACRQNGLVVLMSTISYRRTSCLVMW